MLHTSLGSSLFQGNMHTVRLHSYSVDCKAVTWKMHTNVYRQLLILQVLNCSKFFSRISPVVWWIWSIRTPSCSCSIIFCSLPFTKDFRAVHSKPLRNGWAQRVQGPPARITAEWQLEHRSSQYQSEAPSTYLKVFAFIGVQHKDFVLDLQREFYTSKTCPGSFPDVFASTNDPMGLLLFHSKKIVLCLPIYKFYNRGYRSSKEQFGDMERVGVGKKIMTTCFLNALVTNGKDPVCFWEAQTFHCSPANMRIL